MPNPLDLRAVEARLKEHQTAWQGPDFMLQDMAIIIAHIRALRAALKPFVTEGAVVYINSELPDDMVPQFCAQSVGDFRRAATVLNLARDEEAPREAEPQPK